MKIAIKIVIQAAILLLVALPAAAQKYPERSLVRKGNRAFNKERYDRSIDRYRSALEAAPGSWEATYNLGNALYRTEQYDNAAEALRKAASDTLRSKSERADAYYNLGDVQFRQQKLKESMESFKSALRLNPADEQAKHNYAYVKRLLKDQENNEQQNGQNNEQQNGQNNEQNQQGDQNQEQQDGQNRNEEQNGEQNEDESRQPEQNPAEPQSGEEPGQGEPQPQEGRISEQEQERMLEAIQAQEDETREKLKEKTGVVVRGKKNW